MTTLSAAISKRKIHLAQRPRFLLTFIYNPFCDFACLYTTQYDTHTNIKIYIFLYIYYNTYRISIYCTSYNVEIVQYVLTKYPIIYIYVHIIRLV